MPVSFCVFQHLCFASSLFGLISVVCPFLFVGKGLGVRGAGKGLGLRVGVWVKGWVPSLLSDTESSRRWVVSFYLGLVKSVFARQEKTKARRDKTTQDKDTGKTKPD
jgi:hypothetical protein